MSTSESPPPNLPPEYELERLLGSGCAAHVYLAREPQLDRLVAIKVMDVDSGDQRLAARFEREAKAVASITHPNVVALHRYGLLPNGTPFLVMHYVRGRSLADRLRIEGALTSVEVMRLMCEIAGALTAAHTRGIIHRDVRPANILWEEETGRFLLADFGLAAVLENTPGEHALTHAGEQLGDVRYVSPEQLRAERVTEAADIFSLGVIALEALSGKAPEGDSTRLAMITRRMSGQGTDHAVNASDSPAFNRLLASCLAHDPQERPTAAMVVRVAQSGLWHDGAASEGPPGAGNGVVNVLRRKRLPQWVGGIAAGGWVFLEVVDQLEQHGIVAPIVYPLTLITLIAALAVTSVTAWYHGERGKQKAPLTEKLVIGLLVIGWMGALAWYLVARV